MASAPILDVTMKYIEYVREISAPDVPYAVQVAAYYYMEYVYCKAWATVLEEGPASKYSAFAARWSIVAPLNY